MNTSSKPETIFIKDSELHSTFHRIMIANDFPVDKAEICAEVFTQNSLDGVYTHGVNRFKKFIEMVKAGLVKADQTPVSVGRVGAMEQWDGKSGIGITNALVCTERAMELAREFGIGCVALANTNHWMRAGTYARHATSRGFVLMAWTNTIKNTPAWGAVDPRLGNNPLVIGVPYNDDAIVLDMAMSQYSYGALELYEMKGEKLPVQGGFDEKGNLTNDPASILKSRRPITVGYWKGSGLSLLLDILATVFSGGLSVSEISKHNFETNLSQVFVVFNIQQLERTRKIQELVQQIIDDFHASVPAEPGTSVRYPGERVLSVREKNTRNGIPVLKNVWEEVKSL